MRKIQFVGKHVALVRFSVAIGILQHHDLGQRIATVDWADRVVAVFGDKHVTVCVECDGDRITHQWFGGKQRNLKPRFDLQRGQGLRRSARWRCFGVNPMSATTCAFDYLQRILLHQLRLWFRSLFDFAQFALARATLFSIAQFLPRPLCILGQFGDDVWVV